MIHNPGDPGLFLTYGYGYHYEFFFNKICLNPSAALLGQPVQKIFVDFFALIKKIFLQTLVEVFLDT